MDVALRLSGRVVEEGRSTKGSHESHDDRLGPASLTGGGAYPDSPGSRSVMVKPLVGFEEPSDAITRSSSTGGILGPGTSPWASPSRKNSSRPVMASHAIPTTLPTFENG